MKKILMKKEKMTIKMIMMKNIRNTEMKTYIIKKKKSLKKKMMQ